MKVNPRNSVEFGRVSRRAFTIIELLGVIAVMLILLGVSVPIWTQINQRNALRGAEKQMQAGIVLARQQAIATRQRVWFCVPYEPPVQSNAFFRSNMTLRSFFTMADITSGVGKPASMLSKLEVLPQGVMFDNNFSGWANLEIVGSTSNKVIFRAKGFRFAATGSIYYRDSDDLLNSSGLSAYQLVLRQGLVNWDGTYFYVPGGFGSTSEVRTLSGYFKTIQ